MNTTSNKKGQLRLYIGARTTPDRGQGIGITVLNVAMADRKDFSTQTVQELPAVNPGSILLSPTGRFLYAAHGDRSSISAYRISETGTLEWDHEQGTGGTNPAHITLSPWGTHLLVANHASGSVTSTPILKDGRLGPLSGRIEFGGPAGPHKTDQLGTKPHQVIFSSEGRYLAVPDKGLDTIFFCCFDDVTGNIRQLHAVRLRQGSGPRHMVFHPHLALAYSLNELDNSVTVLDLSDLPKNPPKPIQILPTLPDTDVRDSRGAEIVISPDGNRIYVSNRSGAGDKTPGGPGDDWIAAFVLSESGRLEPPAFVSSCGIRPRFITLTPDATRLLVANEKSGSIWSFNLDSLTGVPELPNLLAHVDSPVSICFG